MGCDDVEGFHECFLGDLPVAAEDFCDVRLLVAAFQWPSLELIAQLATEKIFERLRILIGIDEDEAAPSGDLRFGERPFGGLELRKIPRTGNELEGSIEIPGEAVKRAAKLGGVPAAAFP